jgi:hypothetical protein
MLFCLAFRCSVPGFHICFSNLDVLVGELEGSLENAINAYQLVCLDVRV